MLKKSKCFKLRRLPNNDIQDVHTWPILSRQRIFFFKKKTYVKKINMKNLKTSGR